MRRRSFLDGNFVSERQMRMGSFFGDIQRTERQYMYDVCYNCQRVVENGSLLEHLKSNCSRRRYRKQVMSDKQNIDQQNCYPFVREIVHPSEESEEETVPVRQSLKDMHVRKNQPVLQNNEFKHKIFSPWTLQLSRHIRDYIKPTREIIIESK